MKITHQQLLNIIKEEVDNLDPEIQEGVFDYLKGAGKEAGSKLASTGKSVAKSIGDKATAAKNKVSQVADDIKNAGAMASLRSDISTASQQTGLQIQNAIETFKDLLARAQSMGMEAEENEIKAELQALKNYQQTAAAEVGTDGGEETELPPDYENPEDISMSDLNGGSDVVSGAAPAPVNLPPKPSPKAPSYSSDAPFDWKAKRPEPVEFGSELSPPFEKPPTTKTAKSSPNTMTPIKTNTSAKTQTPKDTSKKSSTPKKQTKLDKDNVEKVAKKLNFDTKATAKELGITQKQVMSILGLGK